MGEDGDAARHVKGAQPARLARRERRSHPAAQKCLRGDGPGVAPLGPEAKRGHVTQEPEWLTSRHVAGVATRTAPGDEVGDARCDGGI